MDSSPDYLSFSFYTFFMEFREISDEE